MTRALRLKGEAASSQAGPCRPAAVPLWTLAGLLALAAFALVAAGTAQASHFRGGTLYAVPTGGLDVSFEGTLAFRSTYAFGSSAACTVGSVFSEGTIVTGDGTTTYTVPALGIGPTYTPLNVPMSARVDACNVPQDWFVATITQADGTPGVPFTYSAATNAGAPWVASWQSSARLSYAAPSYHVNNPDRGWQLQTTVDLSGVPDLPPRPFVPPVVNCRIPATCTIAVPYVDNDPVSSPAMRWSTSTEATASTGFVQPGPCPATGGSPGCGAAVPATLDTSDPSAFSMVWDTTGAEAGPPLSCDRYYSAQVMMGDGRDLVPTDFLVRLCDQLPPVWDTPPSPCGTTQVEGQGTLVTFSVQASSPDPARSVSILALQTPSGSSVTLGAPGNPTSASFSWDTTGAAPGLYLVVFYAEDDLGMSAATCSVTLRIVVAPAWSASSPCLGTLTVAAGDVATATFSASSADPARTLALSVPQSPPGAAATLGVPGNPVQGSISWDTTGVAPGDYPFVFHVVDDLGASSAQDCTWTVHVSAMPAWSPETPCGETVGAVAGTAFAVDAQASSADAVRTLSVALGTLPAGAQWTPGPGNPATGRTSWASLPAGADRVLDLTASDDLGQMAPACRIQVHVIAAPAPDFTFRFAATAPRDLVFDDVRFTDASAYEAWGNPSVAWSWDFGDPYDGALASGSAPTHAYSVGSAAGTPYPACMTLRIGYSTPWQGTVCKPVLVHYEAPQPEFGFVFTGTSPLDWQGDPVRFDDTTAIDARGSPEVSVTWTFADPAGSGDPDGTVGSPVQHAFSSGAAGGTAYRVCMGLTLTYAHFGWSGRTCEPVTVYGPPRPDFAYRFTTTAPDDMAGDPVQFTDLTPVNPRQAPTVSWAWAFNDRADASASSLQDPLNTYAEGTPSGTAYMACLTVRLDYKQLSWSGTACRPVVVHQGPLGAAADCYWAAGRLDVAAPGVIANDGGGTADATALLDRPPANAAQFTLRPDGSFSYIPRPGFSGPDPFTYAIQRGLVRSPVATACIQVAAASSNEPPTPGFSWSPALPQALEPVVFCDGSADADGSIASWLWDFGDGAQAEGATARHSYAAAGDYAVTLTVRDDGGLVATLVQTVHVRAAAATVETASASVVGSTAAGAASGVLPSVATLGTAPFASAAPASVGQARAAGAAPPVATGPAAGSPLQPGEGTKGNGAQAPSTPKAWPLAVDPVVPPSNGFALALTGGGLAAALALLAVFAVRRRAVRRRRPT